MSLTTHHQLVLPPRPAPVPRSTVLQLQISAIASRRRNLIITEELLGLGMSRSAISRWVAAGRLFRIHTGVYAVGSSWLDDEGRRLAAVLAAGPGAVLAGLSALQAWNFSRFRASRIEIAVPKQRRRRIDGARIRRSSDLVSEHVCDMNGTPITSVALTIAELGVELTMEQVCNVIHQARMRRLLELDDLRALLSTYRARPGHAVIVAALSAYDSGSAGTRSLLEDRFLTIARRVVHRLPLVNTHVRAGDDSFEIDLPLVAYGNLCVEVDGPLHDEPNQQAKDRARDTALRAAGYRVVRFHWRDIERRPRWCEQRLREAIADHAVGRG